MEKNRTVVTEEVERLVAEISKYKFGNFGFSLVCHEGAITRIIRISERNLKPENGRTHENRDKNNRK